MNNILKDLKKVKIASKVISNLDVDLRNKIIKDSKEILLENIDLIQIENQKDLQSIDVSNPIYDRVFLSKKRIISLANSCDEIVKLKDPLSLKYDDFI
jgi:glutamate-5-semialdehyde dehydrogenase